MARIDISRAGSSQPIKMSVHDAYIIFHELNSGEFTQEQKFLAIYRIINLEARNSISKAELFEAFRWFFNQHYEVAGMAKIENEVQD
jgi:hypothetical protein